jgi:hypothetical protein
MVTDFPSLPPLLPKQDVVRKIDQVSAALDWYYDLLDRVEELLIEVKDELATKA